MAPLQQPDEDMGLCSFQVNLGATHNRDNAATSHPPEENRTMVTGTALRGLVPTSSPGITPPLAPELRATRASTCNSPTDEDDIEGVLSERRQLKSLAFTVGPSADFSHNEEQPPSVTTFAYATGSSDDKGFSGEETNEKILIPTSYADATDSPQRKDWHKIIERRRLAQRRTRYTTWYPLVPKGQTIIRSRFVFKQKADDRFKSQLLVQGCSCEAGIDYGKMFAPVCGIGDQRVPEAIACQHDWPDD